MYFMKQHLVRLHDLMWCWPWNWLPICFIQSWCELHRGAGIVLKKNVFCKIFQLDRLAWVRGCTLLGWKQPSWEWRENSWSWCWCWMLHLVKLQLRVFCMKWKRQSFSTHLMLRLVSAYEADEDWIGWYHLVFRGLPSLVFCKDIMDYLVCLTPC